MSTLIPPHRLVKGRGAVSQVAGRFETLIASAEDDGWGGLTETSLPVQTSVTGENTRSAISRNDSPDISFQQSINPYRGCEHGCAYCFARPSHAYLGWSPGLDFETKLVAKTQFVAALTRDLAKPSYVCKVLALGTNTDPYQPIEKQYQLTRQVLQLLSDCDHPVGIITKSALVLRDVDLLGSLAERNLVRVYVSVTSLDAEIARKLEPRAAAPHRRLAVLRELNTVGVPVGVLVSPVIPAITDHEIENIVKAAAEAGARAAGTVTLRLPHELKEVFLDWLDVHFPDRKAKVLAKLRELHGGELYRPEFSTRMSGQGTLAQLYQQRFTMAVQRYMPGGHTIPPLDCSRFRKPQKDSRQLSLF